MEHPDHNESENRGDERKKVVVVCGLPQGLMMRVHEIVSTGNADNRRISMPRENSVHLKHGANEVDAEFAHAWYKENHNSDLVLNGVVSGMPLTEPDDTVGGHCIAEHPEVESKGVEHDDDPPPHDHVEGVEDETFVEGSGEVAGSASTDPITDPVDPLATNVDPVSGEAEPALASDKEPLVETNPNRSSEPAI